MSVAFSAVACAGEAELFSLEEGERLVNLAPFSRGSEGGLVVLRNNGGKPLRLRGELLAEGSSRCAEERMWHEIALYQAADGAVAVAIRFFGGAAETGVQRARLFPTMDEACAWLEAFDPSFDLAADFDVADPGISVARVALKAAVLRDRAERLTRGYRGLVGEVLYRLETE